jgi:hypothetical protein
MPGSLVVKAERRRAANVHSDRAAGIAWIDPSPSRLFRVGEAPDRQADGMRSERIYADDSSFLDLAERLGIRSDVKVPTRPGV